LFDNKITLDTYVDVWNLKDSNNKPIIQIQAQIAKEQKEGFVTNKFIKPNSSDKNNYSKIWIKLVSQKVFHL